MTLLLFYAWYCLNYRERPKRDPHLLIGIENTTLNATFHETMREVSEPGKRFKVGSLANEDRGSSTAWCRGVKASWRVGNHRRGEDHIQGSRKSRYQRFVGPNLLYRRPPSTETGRGTERGYVTREQSSNRPA